MLYDRDARAAGASKYNRFFGSMVIGLNGIVWFSRYPLQLISIGGILLSRRSRFLLALGYLDRQARRRRRSRSATRRSWSSSCRCSAASSCCCLGIMGEYVGRIYDEVKRRPKFIVETAYGLEAAGAPLVATTP